MESGGLLACLILVDVLLIDCIVMCIVVWTENWIVGWVLRVGSIRLLSSVDGVWYPFVLCGSDGFTRPKELTHVDVDY